MSDQNTPPTESAAPALDTLEAVAGYLAAAFEAGDPDAMALALARVARSEGLAHLAAAAGLPRVQLAQALDAGAMSLDTTLAIMKVIDLHRPADGASGHIN
jgi:probable addiction module antidote protein